MSGMPLASKVSSMVQTERALDAPFMTVACVALPSLYWGS